MQTKCNTALSERWRPKRVIELLNRKRNWNIMRWSWNVFDGKPVHVIAKWLADLTRREIYRKYKVIYSIFRTKSLEQQSGNPGKWKPVGRSGRRSRSRFLTTCWPIINRLQDLILPPAFPKSIHHQGRQANQKQAGEKLPGWTNQLLASAAGQVLQPKLVNLNSIVMDINKMLRRLIGEDIELILILGSESGPSLKLTPVRWSRWSWIWPVKARDAMPTGGNWP